MANVDCSEMLWKKFMHAVQNTLFPNGVGKDTMFSAASVVNSVSINTTDRGVNNFGIYSLGDVVPANSPNYSPATSGFASSYAQFLDWIDLGGDDNPNLQSQLNIAINGDGESILGFNAVQAGYSNMLATAITLWSKDKNSYKLAGITIAPFGSWVLNNYPLYAEAQNQLDGAQSIVDQLSNQLYGPGYQQVELARRLISISNGAQNPAMQNGYNMLVTTATYVPPGSTAVAIGAAAVPVSIPDAGTGTDAPVVAPVPTVADAVSSFVPLYTLDAAYATTHSDWQRASAAHQTGGMKFVINSNTNDYDAKLSGWDKSFTANQGAFFWSNASGSTSSGAQATNIDSNSSDFSITVSFVGVKAFNIEPGPWWQHGSLVASYCKKLKIGAPDFFSENGPMARRASQVVLGFEPTITIKLATADYLHLKSSWQTATGTTVGIGPFRAEASGAAHSTNNQIHFNAATSSITISPVKSTLPVLLGVISTKLSPLSTGSSTH